MAVMRSSDLSGSGDASELRRLRAFADARSGMEPDPHLRFHLATIAEGRADFLGYDLILQRLASRWSLSTNDLNQGRARLSSPHHAPLRSACRSISGHNRFALNLRP